MSTFWSLWIILLTLICLALVTWVLFANRKVAISDEDDPENKTTGHVYDGIEEYDNPLPKWWFQLFVGTLIFSALYLIWFPGMGAWKGLGGWTSVGNLEADLARAEDQYDATFGEFAKVPVEELIYDNKAMKIGVRLFSNNCAVCHGSDGGGNYSFPNLTDNDWLYGGSPEEIKSTLLHGRAGNMPAWGKVIGEEKVSQTTDYVLQLSGLEHDSEAAIEGKVVFAQYCASCHGVDGKGMKAVGAPNLTDDVWLYEGSREAIAHAIRNGRVNNMPAQKELLREEKIHVLAAYVYSLSFDYDD